MGEVACLVSFSFGHGRGKGGKNCMFGIVVFLPWAGEGWKELHCGIVKERLIGAHVIVAVVAEVEQFFLLSLAWRGFDCEGLSVARL